MFKNLEKNIDKMSEQIGNFIAELEVLKQSNKNSVLKM